MRCALLSLEGGRVVRALIRSSCYSRSPTDDRWSGPKDRGLIVWGRAGAHSGSASVVSAFSSPLLAPGFAWRPSFRGRRCYTHLPPGGLALGVIPTGVRLFFFYFLNLGGGGKWVPAVFFLSCQFSSIKILAKKRPFVSCYKIFVFVFFGKNKKYREDNTLRTVLRAACAGST